MLDARGARGSGKRWALVSVGVAATIAVVVATIVATSRNGSDRRDEPARVASTDTTVSAATDELADLVRAPVHDPVDDVAWTDAAPRSAEAATTPDAGVGKPAGTDDAVAEKAREAKRTKAKVAEHLRAANQARSAGNTLKQLAEADAARKLDRRSIQARYLVGDALVKSGDKANGCKHLHAARSISAARSASAKAGCGNQ